MDDRLIRDVAKNLRSYLTDDPHRDAGLYWWSPQDEREARCLRDLLEISGPPGHRARLVEVALRDRRIDPPLAGLLSDPDLPRPEWADGPVPWRISQVIHVGDLHLPGGHIGVCDPDDDTDPIAYAQATPVPTTAPVWVVTATHPLVREPFNAAVDVPLIPDAPITRWGVLPPGRHDEGGVLDPYYGRIGVGAPETFTDLNHDGDRIEDVYGGEPVLVDYGPAGSVLAVASFTGPCTIYLAHDAHDRVTRLIVDLGVINWDPTAHGDIPWSPTSS